MNYIHVVSGDLAARLLSEALVGAGRHDRIIALRDDLALGPLRCIDDTSTARIAFWQRALGAGEHGLSQTIVDAFDAENVALHELSRPDDAEIVAWHAQNASDQLMLRRVAYRLRNMPQRLNEIGITSRSLSCQSATRDAAATNEARDTHACTPDALAERLHHIAPISVLRISRLALEWQELKQLNNEMRRWRDNTFQSATYTDIDNAIIDAASKDTHLADGWLNCQTIAPRLRSVDPGTVASDAIVAWRCRELTTQGRLTLDGDPIMDRAARVRLSVNERASEKLALRTCA